MAAKREFQAAAHADPADRGDHRLAAAFDAADNRHEMRLGGRLGRAEFTDVRAAGESGAGSDEHYRFDGRIGIGFFDALDDCLTQFEPQAVNRRVVECEDRNASFDLQSSLIRAHSLFHCAELGSVVLAD
jgi:hypothetical protein